jgi:DNA-binding response OmpR family regulator
MSRRLKIWGFEKLKSEKVLIVEDDPKIAGAVAECLQHEGFKTTVAHTGEDGFFQMNAERFDAVILDLMLPGRSGLEVLQTLRKRGDKIPVLLLTARDSIEDRVLGLNLGADDYLVKPFAIAELVARMHALLRRGKGEPELKLSLEDLKIDVVTRRVTRDSQNIDLTQKEYELLEFLLRHKNRVVSREMLSHDVWRETARATSLDNVIDVHIARLRRKIDEGFERKLLKTIRGVGFSLSHTEESR